MNKLSVRAACLLCGDGTSTIIQAGIRHRPDLKVRRCRGCGLVRLDPLPTQDELDRFYTEAYRAEHEPGLDPQGAHEAELPEARTRVERLKSLLGPRVSLLEVGSSSGAFLKTVAPSVRSVLGVEPAEAHRTWAAGRLGLDLVADLAMVDGRRFDLICLFHVLEHVRQPAEFVRRLLGLLAPGGKIVIEVPNVDDALVALYRVPSYAPFYYQDAHLWYFSPVTLGRVIETAGGKASIAGVQRYDLSNHLRWMLTGKPGGKGYYKEVISPALDKAYAEDLIKAGHADTLWAVAERAGAKRR